MKEDTVHLRSKNRRPGSSRGTPKSRHGYLSPARVKDRMLLLGECQTYSLEDKLALSVQIMKEAASKVKKIIIGWSGGKDSTLLIEIALQAGVMDRVEVVYVDSGVEPPETLAYVDLYAKLRNLKYTRLEASTSFWQMTRTHGWPILGGDRFAMPGTWKVNAAIARKKGDELAAQAIERAKISGACSDVLKKAPMDRHAKYIGSNCTAMGLMAQETRQRMLVWLQKGHFYFHSGDKKWILWPIWHWNPKDVFQYFRTNNIPMCALYNPGRLSRNGCQPCMKSWKWPDNNFIDTYKHHPETWWDFMFKRGLCERLWEIKKIYHRSQIFRYGFDINASPAKVRSYAEKYPEFFWQL